MGVRGAGTMYIRIPFAQQRVLHNIIGTALAHSAVCNINNIHACICGQTMYNEYQAHPPYGHAVIRSLSSTDVRDHTATLMHFLYRWLLQSTHTNRAALGSVVYITYIEPVWRAP